MQERARVVRIEGDIVFVVPIDIAGCAGCANAECASGGSLFKALNREGLDLAPGMEVHVVAPVRRQLAQALLAIGVPVLLASLSWKALGVALPESGSALRAGVAFLAFIAGAILVYALSRSTAKELPEIVSIP
jgi:hypothetical protein